MGQGSNDITPLNLYRIDLKFKPKISKHKYPISGLCAWIYVFETAPCLLNSHFAKKAFTCQIVHIQSTPNWCCLQCSQYIDCFAEQQNIAYLFLQLNQMFELAPIDAAGNLDYKSLCYIVTHGQQEE